MSLPVPLGVRVWNSFDDGGAFDLWITKLVDDISFRSVIPGGFAAATIRLHRPAPVTIYSSATATGTGTSITSDYLVASDADAADIAIGDRVHIYDSTGAIRFGGQPFKVTAKNSAFGFTNIVFTPNASASTVSGDVMRCSTATGYLQSDPIVGHLIARLFNRIQVVDLRSGEICWEGRIEDPARSTDDETWELGCLGSMVAATDVRRPIFYVDSGVDSWLPDDSYVGEGVYEMSTDEAKKSVTLTFNNNIWPADTLFNPITNQRCEETGQYLGRFDITYDGASPFSQLAAVTAVFDVDFGVEEDRIDVTTLTTAATRKGNPINAVNSFTRARAQQIRLYLGNDHATTNVTVTDTNKARETLRNPRVQAQRVDRECTPLTAAADYPNDYVTVPEVVEDVFGRYLVKMQSIFNTIFSGQCRTADAYIDASSTVQITNLTFYDGATAADILNELMTVQPDAYWAIWESKYGATNAGGDAEVTGFRFEWATWPSGWGYQASSVDGMQEQPSGENLYNTLFYQYSWDSVARTGYKKITGARADSPPLDWGEVNRAVVIKREGSEISTLTAQGEAVSKIGQYKRLQNAGTLKVSRPIEFYDPGTNSSSGGSRMVDPWHIRPGRLIRITDLPAQAKFNAFQHGASAPPAEIDGTVFKVVATEYSTADNTCTLELDQVSTWATPSQIGKAAEGKPTTLKVQG